LYIPPKISTQTPNFEVYFENSLIPGQNSCKYLGVLLDFRLDYKSHILHIEVKIARAVCNLSKPRFIFSKSTLLHLYHTLVHPHILFALSVWGSTFPF